MDRPADVASSINQRRVDVSLFLTRVDAVQNVVLLVHALNEGVDELLAVPLRVRRHHAAQ